jgi:hypothetical protein
MDIKANIIDCLDSANLFLNEEAAIDGEMLGQMLNPDECFVVVVVHLNSPVFTSTQQARR